MQGRRHRRPAGAMFKKRNLHVCKDGVTRRVARPGAGPSGPGARPFPSEPPVQPGPRAGQQRAGAVRPPLRCAWSLGPGRKRQERRVDVEVLAPRPDLLKHAFGCEGLQVDGGRFGRSLKGRSGSNARSMYPALFDTCSERVDRIDTSLQRVDSERIYRHIGPCRPRPRGGTEESGAPGIRYIRQSGRNPTDSRQKARAQGRVLLREAKKL